MLHDYDTLFLYQKHSKLRVLNLPVFYTPYLLTPSPLRKERKSGFLTPSINLNFFDTKISQSTSFHIILI
jgi:lipopolysaccharide assembly outer membrane protein LptD (OstA)